MRDIAIVAFIVGMIPLMISRPWIGVMMWIWISVMNPHKFAFGFAHNLPVATIAAAATLIGLVVSKEKVKLPINATTVLLMLFPLWTSVTLMFAFHFDDARVRWEEVMKIFLFVLIAASVFNTRKHLDTLIWVLVLSIGFFGVKGGLFTILTGGASRVYGPPGASFLSDNNAISVALVMTIPLMYYLSTQQANKWIRRGLYGAMALSAVAVLGSQSRGAFLAVVVMSTFLWLKSRQKLTLGILVAVLLPIAIVAMPDSWKDRMRTVQTYEQDASAMGRINAWTMAFNLANDRPLVGGGFELYSKETFAKYAPDPDAVHAAHSIYFQILGEHGYVGLFLLLSLWGAGWINARRVAREARGRPEFAWAAELARAIQVSFIGYATGGLFVNIGYWELPYYELITLMILVNMLRAPAQTSAPAPVVARPASRSA